ncbi:dinuclear metal center protein, YbgI family [Brevibacterium mcbrellneri ATCC 49030]|uniref:GTP cyclohydrolase 1 type 2 homolog n=1 Tax=Brevibacterium mcbrellneri ATCC 49030 TaxID=585530 RepID=D4YNZ4_9MICO|nr:Nif3-like dinuclear metal center hexameric protein [Brevibacterium mcbrellneri]EFG47134.1 dinuclear metal center protein, YbgI family [Brevibacterium mcbrellneri ATCC 49030]
MTHATLGDIIAHIEKLWPTEYAESWDSNGLATGDLNARVSTILMALDPMDAVIDEAVSLKAELLFTHHPLLLRGVTSVAAHTLKGGALTRLISHGIAQYNAHTNADSAQGGVSDVLADMLELTDRQPITSGPNHPEGVGLGRVGTLPQPRTVSELAHTLARSTPATKTGIRVAGDPNATVSRVAVLAGSGDSLFDEVRAHGADVYVTSDLRHHPATEARDISHRTSNTPHLIDVAHWAAESPWMSIAATQLGEKLKENGFDVDIHVSTTRTDPWDLRIPSHDDAQGEDDHGTHA